MSDVALRMEHVYKKFRKGETYNSLRDLLPAMTGKMFRGQELDAKDEREFWALRIFPSRSSKARRSASSGATAPEKHCAQDPESHHAAYQRPHGRQRPAFCFD